MQNNLNFFGWIREGVKQSVLLGVSDAIETIGTPDDPQKLHPQVAALMSSGKGTRSQSLSQSQAPRLSDGPSAAPKKRLGRSLKDIDPQK